MPVKENYLLIELKAIDWVLLANEEIIRKDIK